MAKRRRGGDAESQDRLRRRDRLLSDLAEARALRDRVAPRRARQARRRAALRAITFRR